MFLALTRILSTESTRCPSSSVEKTWYLNTLILSRTSDQTPQEKKHLETLLQILALLKTIEITRGANDLWRIRVSQFGRKSILKTQLGSKNILITQLGRKSILITQLGSKSILITQLGGKSILITQLRSKSILITQHGSKSILITQLGSKSIPDNSTWMEARVSW